VTVRVGEAFRLARHWVPFTALTVYYGLVSLLLGPLTRERRASLWAMRAWCRAGLRFLRISADVTGLENVPTGGFVYVSNHQSLLDTLLLGAFLPGDYKWAVKSSLLNIPFLGWHLRLSGHVEVDRGGDRKTVVSTLDRFVEVLRRGKPLVVFPEGTRSPDGRVRAFKKGVFHSAVRAGVPVVPVALYGTGAAMAKGASNIVEQHVSGAGARRVSLRVGEPVQARSEGSEWERTAELRDRARAAVLASYRALTEAAAGPPSSAPGTSEPAP
jgi:1-acyl-sn-glycerol-3-phosphate acyltransferase